ncbi:MAG: single-stranded-DNA-specific exonuclease RecJ [Candidatus Blackburnbacteria bacterium]|nr:single-stranded-DNA-specific exonuclease RecJ [Candidatus Blackburnbacteria bacterium]
MKRKTQKVKRGTQEILNTLLQNRGIKTKKEKKEFFNPKHPQEFTLKEVGINPRELNLAVLRIKQAIENKEKIIVYGDYDVDGICATAVLWETLFAFGASVLPHIPSRFTEGYGLNEESIKKLKEDDPKLGLIITVDHGIVAHKKVDFAKTLGVDVIVTDHHEPGETKPKACAVVHTTKISGSALAWILATSVTKIRNSRLRRGFGGQAKFEIRNSDHLGLVALGTVADILPLVGYNRAIVVHGLKELRKTGRSGIKALCEEASIKQEDIGTYHIGFIIGPRLNAAGRLEHALDALRLLCTKNKERARELAAKLGKINRLRQEKTDQILKHIEDNFGVLWATGGMPKLFFVHHGSYEEGVIGVVAGKLVEKYWRPAIVMTKGKEFSKASARSVNGVNIVELIKKVGENFFVGVGGHKMAAGFTIKTEHIEAFSKNLAELSEKEINESSLVRDVRIDCELELSGVTKDLFLELQKFAPHGFGNPEPTFRTRNVWVEDARLVGKDNGHLKLVVAQRQKSDLRLEAVGFGMGEWYTKLSPDKPVDIIYSVAMDNWNGAGRLQLKIKHLKPHG